MRIVGMNDFDFLTGSWHVTNHRREQWLADCPDWVSFPGTSTAQSVFDGGGCLDEIVFPTLGSRGLTLRLFDPERREWSIYWANSRTGLLGPPVVGGFTDGLGRFHGEDEHEGKPVLVRFTWSAITADSARWEQEFSADEGQTWESNWIMEFQRKP
ncbi:hypothetical protein N8J89_17620 [Crossiella sp. CA-258035]|uniref:hypothetical protein n=1 Tax=Crossiella sp. CA-258035 TaxID=2981138 RepID=UPI0024BC97FE|nr:hypothetical protein [Crossiella sp. CA-258035]WHT22810.1 hypothetical protein N8J89_17620 [Crossiella sp. CA-258035]